jgi:hypothetical protein
MPLSWVFDHLDFINYGNVIDFFELRSMDGAAHYCWIEKVFLFLASVQVAYHAVVTKLFCSLPG